MGRNKLLPIIIAGASLSGCVSAANLENYEALQKEDRGEDGKLTHHDILRTYFTDKAYEELKDIPIMESCWLPFEIDAYPAGITLFDKMLSLCIGAGWGRKVILTEESIKKWGAEVIIHEYIHHADNLGFIDHRKFKKAYEKMQEHIIAKNTEKILENNLMYQYFPSRYDEERIAFVGSRIAASWVIPEEMKEAYKDMLK